MTNCLPACGGGLAAKGALAYRFLRAPIPSLKGRVTESPPATLLMDFVGFLVTQCLNALSQAALLFFLGVGLTLIFGIMRIVNFAHGAFFMLGAYVGYSAVQVTGSFWAALVVAPLVVGGSARRSNSACCAGCTGATATRS